MNKLKPKNAAEKRNRERIRLAIKSPILKSLHEGHYEGGILSIFADADLDRLADLVVKSVLYNEEISICLKRTKR
jgi:hypothetical protein